MRQTRCMAAAARRVLLLAVATSAATVAAASAALGATDFAGSMRWEAFRNSFAMIIATELGDKTFFIAALLAMQHSRRLVFLGAWGAMVTMTVLSAIIGLVLPSVLSREYTHWGAVALFLYFGSKLLHEGLSMFRRGEGAGPSDELEEVQQSLKDSGRSKGVAIAMKAFTLSFVAEWGDRSQLSTIALAAAKDPVGVTLGGVVGHLCCTSLAVLGGHVLAARISERAVLALGGALFILFAAHAIYSGPGA